jgi:hypothetical protein
VWDNTNPILARFPLMTISTEVTICYGVLGRWLTYAAGANAALPVSHPSRWASKIFHEGIFDLGTMIVGDARGRALNLLHQPIKIVT